MRTAIIAEGKGDQAVITNILKGQLGIEESDIHYMRPELQYDQTDLSKMPEKAFSNWTLVKHHCIDERDSIDDFLALNEEAFIVIQIDTAERTEIGYDVIEPQKGDLKQKDYCCKLYTSVVNQINKWLDNNFTNKIAYAVCIEETEAWLLALYGEKDTSKSANPKSRLSNVLNKKLSGKDRNILKEENEFKKMYSLSKDFRKNKNLEKALLNNNSLALFCDSINKIQIEKQTSMYNSLVIYNTLSRSKEIFTPLHPQHVGLYVCGPTVYGDPHLGHARPAITFDILYRYLTFLKYKVRYVRNITDVGHLVNDADEGEDKIAKKAQLEDIEPMEVVQYYLNRYHKFMDMLNVLPPSIEPHASGHIIEQIELIKTILDNGFAYEVSGSVYFDVEKYNKQYNTYGKLSGRVLDDLQSNTRNLDGQSDKRNSFDFALWKKANPEHIMRWPSPWGEGFPGWHLECSAMSTKYLGSTFDIHGGGMDLLFPHHECEIAQNVAAGGHEAVRYWMHNNMLTVNGQKMGKSLGNFITLEEFFTGKHSMLQQAYSPMTIRFFILQAHYRSTLDFSNEALQAAEKGLQRLLKAGETLGKLKPSDKSTVNIDEIENACYAALSDDLNTPIAISVLFDAVRVINSVHELKESLTDVDLQRLKTLYTNVVFDILGLQQEATNAGESTLANDLIDFVLQLRQNAKANKDFATSDIIRDALSKMGVVVKDTKGGYEWEIN